MKAAKPFPQAAFLDYLEGLASSTRESSTPVLLHTSLPPGLIALLSASERADSGHTGASTKAGECLIALLRAQRATLQADAGSALAAEELRRYQKFARPGQPTPHIVGLRQKQAAARRATSVSRQSFVEAAAAFVREAHIAVPARVALEAFIGHWIDTTIPKSFSPNE